jgi:hypothetical protein
MGFLKRLFGGGEAEPAHEEAGTAGAEATPDTASEVDAPTASRAADDEQARDRELLREEARRLDDDLIQRQLRYADRSWTPPAQGGSRRSDDEDAKRESAR